MKLTQFHRAFTFIKDGEDLRYPNDFTESCLRAIEESAEYQSDSYLVQLVKIQSIAEEINEALPRYSQDFSSASSAPVALCMRTLHSKLDSFRMKLPLHLQQNRKHLSSAGFSATLLTQFSIPSHALP